MWENPHASFVSTLVWTIIIMFFVICGSFLNIAICVSLVKVSEPWIDTFSSAPTSPRMWNPELEWDDCYPQIVSVSRMFASWFLELWFIIKVKIPKLIKWSCRSPQFCWPLSLEWLTYFEHICPISFKQMSFWHPLLDPHRTIHQSNIGFHMLEVLDQHPSNLVSTLAPAAGVEKIYFVGAFVGADNATRPTDPDYAIGYNVSFTDGYPFLLISQVLTLHCFHHILGALLNQPRKGIEVTHSLGAWIYYQGFFFFSFDSWSFLHTPPPLHQASLDALNAQLAEALPINRFRPK